METPDLEMTSPATITRCNVIYVCEEDIKKNELIKTLLPVTGNKEVQDRFTAILNIFSSLTILRIMKITKLLFFR